MSSEKKKLEKRLIDIIRMRTVLHPRDWKNESRLMMSRWFDYRFTSPLELTLLFREIYTQNLRNHVRRHEDADLAHMVTGTRDGLPRTREKWFTALWHARQQTDALFVPYDLLVNFSFDFSSRRKRRWNMLPHQLHPSPSNAEAWTAVFDEAVENQLLLHMRRIGNMPQYRLENDIGLPAQRHFREIMLEEVKHSHRRLDDQIAEFVYAKRHLKLDSVLRTAPEDERGDYAERAKSLFDDGGWPEAERKSLESADLLPSCFGIAETITPSEAPCCDCPLLAKCQSFSQWAIDQTTKTAGSASPILELDRKRSRAYVARFRDNKKKVAAAALF